VPVAITLKVAVSPTLTLCEVGCVVILGACGASPEEFPLSDEPQAPRRSKAARLRDFRIEINEDSIPEVSEPRM
jgi:hypothetical protein